MRRRDLAYNLRRHPLGNTSACAEKRIMSKLSQPAVRKYLRVCGEEKYSSEQGRSLGEIPPRVRRRDSGICHAIYHNGNTSACAEKSHGGRRRIARAWKYLRVCGEELRLHRFVLQRREIPPRVRRRDSLSCDYITRIREFRGLRLITMLVVKGHQNPG